MALLEALGSVKRALSYGDLAELLNDRDKSRRRYPSTIQKWIEGVVPDLRSIKLMAELAGVTFEEFALGAGQPGAPVTEIAPTKSGAPLSPKVRSAKVPGEDKEPKRRRA